MDTSDSYLTIKGTASSQFVEQRSRFISFAWHVTSADEVKERITALQKEYYDARHCCYAYVLGADRAEWRANDNGEPSGTAGKPILGQINSAGLTDILIAVVRYFGGVKLGTSGLIEAYRRAAADVIAASESVTLYVERELTVLATYGMVNEVMRAVKELNLKITSQEYGQFTASENGQSHGHDKASASQPYDCRIALKMRCSLIQPVTDRFTRLTESERIPSILMLDSGWC